MGKTPSLGIRVQPETKAALEKAAADDLRLVVGREVERRGSRAATTTAATCTPTVRRCGLDMTVSALHAEAGRERGQGDLGPQPLPEFVKTMVERRAAHQ